MDYVELQKMKGKDNNIFLYLLGRPYLAALPRIRGKIYIGSSKGIVGIGDTFPGAEVGVHELFCYVTSSSYY